MRFHNPIKKRAKLTYKLLTDAQKLEVVMCKLDEDPLQHRVHFLSFMNALKIILSQLKETYMLIMEFLSIRREDLPDYSKNTTWNLLHTYIDAHSQILID